MAAIVNISAMLMLLLMTMTQPYAVNGQVTTACVQWQSFDNQNSVNGILYPNYRTLTDCQALCASLPTCVALDFDQSATPCWIHTNANDLLPSNTYNLRGILQFIVNRSCSAPPNCAKWTSYSNQNSLFGINYQQFTTLSDCLALCLSKSRCVAVDFDNTTNPCWIHTSSDDLLPVNTYFLAGRTQYILSRTCTSTGCVQWSAFNVQNSINGVNYPLLKTLTDCLAFCASVSQCVAVDFDNSSWPCWLHVNARDLLPENTFGLPGVTQFIASRTCETLSCAQWTAFSNQNSVRGIQYSQLTTIADCQNFCVINAQCVAVDFDSTCWVHLDANNLTPANTRSITGITQYRLDRTCRPTRNGCVQWSGYTNQNSVGASNILRYKTLSDCLTQCASDTQCVAVDYDSTQSPCWIHTNSSDLTPDNTYNLRGITQYIVNRQCLFGCVQWNTFPSQLSLNGILYDQYKTLAACQAACISSAFCVAIDFDNTSSPCYLHLNADDLIPTNSYEVAGVVQYILNRTCPQTPTTVSSTTPGSSTLTTSGTAVTTLATNVSSTTSIVSQSSTNVGGTGSGSGGNGGENGGGNNGSDSSSSSSTFSVLSSTSSSISTISTTLTVPTRTLPASCVWTVYLDTNAPGGIPRRETDLFSCMQTCINTAYCIGIDIDSNPGATFCWLIVRPQATGVLSPFTNVAHYSLTRNVGCPLYDLILTTTAIPQSTKGCLLRTTPNANADAGNLVGLMNETACIKACQDSYPTCVAVDYRTSDGACYTQTSVQNRKWNSCCQRFELTCSDQLTATCTDSFAVYNRLRVISIAGLTSIAGRQTASDCQQSCLLATTCTGYMWISNDTAVPSGGQRCTIFTQQITATAASDQTFTTFVRQTCLILSTTNTQAASTAVTPPAGYCVLDVVVVVDTSGSNDTSKSSRLTSFLTDLFKSSALTIGPYFDRVSLVAFSSTANVIFDLQQRSSLTSVLSSLSAIPLPNGETNTPAAVLLASQILNNTATGARSNAVKAMLLITDSAVTDTYISRFPAAIAAANSIGIRRIAVGVSNNINRNQLADFVSSSQLTSFVESYSVLSNANQFAANALASTCSRASILSTAGPQLGRR